MTSFVCDQIIDDVTVSAKCPTCYRIHNLCDHSFTSPKKKRSPQLVSCDRTQFYTRYQLRI
ncbi:MAG: hypothetical protein KME54_28795 [Tolypothrix brevis GSE-NOS-MK-07-07A]|nr:hypothetical protein [Tolypothrix brevis GSE-NOS-MK-07-07A]